MQIRPMGVVPHGQKDRLTDISKLMVALRNFANVPKSHFPPPPQEPNHISYAVQPVTYSKKNSNIHRRKQGFMSSDQNFSFLHPFVCRTTSLFVLFIKLCCTLICGFKVQEL